MRLSDRLGRQQGGNRDSGEQRADRGAAPAQNIDLAGIAARIHPKIIEKLDMAAVSTLSPDELKVRLCVVVEQVIHAERLAISDCALETIVDSVVD